MTSARQDAKTHPFLFSLSLSLFSSPEKTAARNKGRRVSRNVRAAAGEVRSRRIPPHLRTYFFLSPACFPPSRSVTSPPAGGRRAGAPRHVSEAFTTHGFSTKTNTKPTFFPHLGFRMSMSPNFAPSRTPLRRTSPVDGGQGTRMPDPLSDARLIWSSFFLLDPQCGGRGGG